MAGLRRCCQAVNVNQYGFCLLVIRSETQHRPNFVSMEVKEKKRQSGAQRGDIWRIITFLPTGQTFKSVNAAEKAGFRSADPHILIKED